MVGGASQGILSSLEDVLGGTVATTEHGKVKRQPLGSLQRGLNPVQAIAATVADLSYSLVLATLKTHPYTRWGGAVTHRPSRVAGTPYPCWGEARFVFAYLVYLAVDFPEFPTNKGFTRMLPKRA